MRKTKMTQEEAVKRIRDWLPEDAFEHGYRTEEAKTVSDLWFCVKFWYKSLSTDVFHFSRVPCGCIYQKGIWVDSERFKRTACLCTKVVGSRVLWFKQHIPRSLEGDRIHREGG